MRMDNDINCVSMLIPWLGFAQPMVYETSSKGKRGLLEDNQVAQIPLRLIFPRRLCYLVLFHYPVCQ